MAEPDGLSGASEAVPGGRSSPRWRSRHQAGAAGQGTEADFVEFARAAAPRLRHHGFLMCRDWHLAQDFVQITLAKLFVSWKRISQVENLDAYSRKVLYRVLVDHQRVRSSQEVVTPTGPEHGWEQPLALRLTLIEALGRLPVRDRAIVVLRYWEDQSVETVAEVLGISTAVVKSQSMRSLSRLRELLGDARAELLTEERM
jgi:RNA polymerase sigma-70 factor (sigma-E family)